MRLRNLMMGDEFDGSVVGLTGYSLKITGGSDKSGFPMKKGVHGTQKPKILMKAGVGYRPKGDVRKRKRVRGEKIDGDIVQVNTLVVKRAKKGIEELLGLKSVEEKPEAPVEEKKEGEAKEKKPEAPMEEKPEVKEEAAEVKPVEEKPKAPAEEKKVEEAKEKKPEEKPVEKKTVDAKVGEKPSAEEKPEDKKILSEK
jgi:small subunit ribosomal protein S6e